MIVSPKSKKVQWFIISSFIFLLSGNLTAEKEESSKDEKANSQPIFEQSTGYEKQAPAFTVKTRKTVLEAFPCSDCHEDEPVNAKERKLEEEHEDILLEHGAGRFWCLTCHHSLQKDYLNSLNHNFIDFDQSYRLCGQCHFQHQKDWFFGGHGKRIGNWRGPRQLVLCTECHDPHSPSIKPISPNPPPKIRAGLEAIPHQPRKLLKLWEQY